MKTNKDYQQNNTVSPVIEYFDFTLPPESYTAWQEFGSIKNPLSYHNRDFWLFDVAHVLLVYSTTALRGQNLW